MKKDKKMSPQGKYYTINLKSDQNGNPYAVELFNNSTGRTEIRVTLHDIALLYQYTLSQAQMNYLESIEKKFIIK